MPGLLRLSKAAAEHIGYGVGLGGACARARRYADPILDRLDPNRYIAYRLYRDSTQYTGSRHCRDLTKLNRDPARVLFVSADADAYHLQPENAIKVARALICALRAG